MKRRLVVTSLLLLALSLVVVPIALASNTWYVDGVHGKNKNDCKSPQTACKTIGHAIALAHSGDTVRVTPAAYHENLTISVGLKIIGAGASVTIIDGGRNGPVVTIPTTAHVTLSKLTFQDGESSHGGGINNSGTLTITNDSVSGNYGQGGGINNSGTLTITNTRVTGNYGGGLNGAGGGVWSSGALAITNSTVSGNRVGLVGSALGGGIWTSGTLTLNKSTVSGNSAGSADSNYTVGGGGIYASGAARLIINNSTVSGNVAAKHNGAAVGGGIFSQSAVVTISNSTVSANAASGGGVGGGIYGLATLQNTIVANSQGGNCSGTMTSNGYNLSSDNTCNFNNTGDLNNTDPKLGRLENWGGPTIPLLSGSPAIDAGNPNGCTDGQGRLLKTDQRGMPRPDKEDTGGCDMGAYERQKD
jgi:hypothetical protein